MPVWAAFQHLDPYRPRLPIGGGMGPGILLPLPIPRPDIRSEGERLGYRGEGLEDFCEIVEQLDHALIEATARREADRAKASAKQAQQRSRPQRR